MKQDAQQFEVGNRVELEPLPASEREPRASDRREEDPRPGPSGLLRRLGFGRGTEPAAQALTPSCPIDPTSKRIFLFLMEHGLLPTPDNFQLGWTYFVSPLHRLSVAIDETLLSDGKLTEETAALLLAEYRAGAVANDLAGLLAQAKSGIADGTKVVKRSRDDVTAFGDALRTELNESDQRTAPARSTMMKLTQAMIQKTSEAERELRGVAGQLARMEKRVRSAERLAGTDALTGLPNRRAFSEALEQEIARARAKSLPLSVAFCDIDHFKQINDTHGHATGDRVLKYVAGVLAAAASGSCHVARHGGEEFVMLFRDQSADAAFAIVDRVRDQLSLKTLMAKDSGRPIGTVTFSAGIASLEPGTTVGSLLHHADMALYRAKKSGRNRVCH